MRNESDVDDVQIWCMEEFGIDIDREEFPDSFRKFCMVFYWFSVAFVIAVLLWWRRRREHHALRMRQYWIVVVIGVGVILHVTVVAYRNHKGVYSMSCDLHAWTSYWVVPLLIGAGQARLLMFYNLHRYWQLVVTEHFRERRLFNKSIATGLSSRFETVKQWRGFIASVRWMCSGCTDPMRSRLIFRQSRSNLPEEDSDSDSQRAKRAWWLFALRYMSRQNGLPLMTLLFYIFLGLGISISQYFPIDESPYGLKGCYGCRQSAGDYRFFTVVIFITATMIGYLLWRLRGVPDPLQIKFEIQVSYLASVIIIVGGIVFAFLVPETFDEESFDILILGNFIGLLYFAVQTLYPIYLSYKTVDVQSGEVEGLTLLDWLEDQAGRPVFARYLATEFSLENYLCYTYCQDFHDIYDDNNAMGARIEAEEIINMFLKFSSPWCVNVSSVIRNNVLDRFEALPLDAKPPRELFAGVQASLYKLMCEDSYPRFLKSEFAKERPALLSTISMLSKKQRAHHFEPLNPVN